MKAGVNTYCFGPMLLDGEMGLAQVIQFIGRETVAECFEVLARFWDKGRDEAAQARDAKRVLESVGLEVSCYSLDSDFAVYDRAQRRACVDQCIRRLDTALILGTHVIRLDPRSSLPPGTSPQDVDVDDLMARMAESAREIADAAAAKGITVGVENHGTLLGRSAQIARIVALVDRPNFGVNLDFTNFRLVFGEDHVAATRALAPKVVHVHAKDLIFSSEPMPGEGWFEAPCGGYCKRAVGGEGEARWPEVFRILKDAGYDGTLSLEIADPADIKGSVVKGVANIRRTIAEIGAS